MYNKISTLVIAFFLGLTFMGKGQEKETVFGTNTFKEVGFMLAPSYGFTQMDGANASLLNARAGIVFNDRLTVGGFYGLSLSKIQPESETITDIYMDFQSYGGFIEYTTQPSKLLHFSFPLFIGGGEVQMDNEIGDAGLGEQNFFLIEPGAFLEINLHKYIRLNVGASYRIVGDMTYRNMDQQDLSGLTAQIGLKFGI